MSRADDLYGSNDIDKVFPDGAPTGRVPFPQAGRRKDRKDYDAGAVKTALQGRKNAQLKAYDPRELSATQPSVVRGGVQHYLSGQEGTFADSGNAGNETPVVYEREGGTKMLLSGHHRAVKALLRGEQFHAIPVSGGWGEPRG